MNLPFFFARRYLFAKKSHNVINIISAISAIGMAIGTAALVIILSVYNGFDSLIRQNLDDLAPDALIKPSEGKVFLPEGEAFDWLYGREEVAGTSFILQESVFINYEGRQDVATAKGVEDDFQEKARLDGHVRVGEFRLRHGEIPMCAVGSGLAGKMGISPHFVAPLEIFYPDREKSISLSNPAATLHSVKARPSCLISFNADDDNRLILLPIDRMRDLLKYEEEISALEVRFRDGMSQREQRRFIREMQERFGPAFRVQDRFRQNESLYKMMRYEKAAIFLILIFIIIIIAFNIFGSLSMLIIEKQDDIGTLGSLGAPPRLIRRIFVLEGWLISLLGLVAGLLTGLGLAFLQQRFGFVKMPGDFLVKSYPVIVQWTDIVLTAAGVALIGYLIALLPVATWYKEGQTELTKSS